MEKVTIEISDEIIEALCIRFGFTAFIDESSKSILESDNALPQSKIDFIESMTIEWLNREAKDHIVNTALNQTRTTVEESLKQIEIKKIRKP